MITDFEKVISALTEAGVELVVIGGLALTVQGSSRATVDFDACYARNPLNFEKMTRALAPFHPRLRGAPPELPFFWDAQTIRSGLNFTLDTDIGAIDFLGEVAGLGTYQDALALSIDMTLFGHAIKVLGLDGLEKTKRAAARAKDLLDLAEIEALRRAQESK